MAAYRSRVLKRITELLNLCDPGTYSATLSARNKTRNATAIADFTDEAGLMICRAMADRPNEFRYQFLADTTPITTSGDQMPAHLGPPAKITITPYIGATPVPGKKSDYQKIESYRKDVETVYDEIAHDHQGSTLAGLYDIWDDAFYFTGLSAVLSLARLPVRADNLTLIPEILESTWIKLGVGMAAKVGTGGYEAGIIGEYGKRGMQDLEEFKAGGRVFKEVDEPAQTSAVHTLVK